MSEHQAQQATPGAPGQLDLHARQRLAPGFDQGALGGITLLRFSGDGPDPIGDHVSLLAGVMGVGRQLVSCQRQQANLERLGRLMVLHPGASLSLASPELCCQLSRTHGEGARYFALVRVGRGGECGAPPELNRAVPARYYTVTRDSVVMGDSLEQVQGAARRTTRRSNRQHSAEGVLAAGLLLGDLLAAGEVYRSPLTDRWMPRAPDVQQLLVCSSRRGGRRARVLLVGGGGALSHAFCEAVLADSVLRRCLGRGQLILVDPDQYELSNLSRQTLAGGQFNLGQEKSVATSQELLALWSGHAPRVERLSEPFCARMIEEYQPQVVGLFPDNFAARHAAWAATRALPGRLVIHAASEFTYGVMRAVVTGRGCCLDCGPEELTAAAEEEAQQQAARQSCGQEVTPSNVLSNALAGALAAVELKRFLTTKEASPQQTVINWGLPRRLAAEAVAPCSCVQER